MSDLQVFQELHRPAQGKIVLLVLDGLGGLPVKPGGPTELEAASTPNLDRLASEGSLGQLIPVRPGITPGSGPAHLALFGYDPLAYRIGRGVLEATGVGLVVDQGDVAARGNFCTLDSAGRIVDRRAGRLPSPEAARVVERLRSVEVPGARFEIRHVREYRFVLVLRGPGFEADIEDTDPQSGGVAPQPARARAPDSAGAALKFNGWIEAARSILADEEKANGVTLRGFSGRPDLPPISQVFGVRAGCAAVYPMYRGVAQLAGMDPLPLAGEALSDEVAALAGAWDRYDYFFLHYKKTDSRGEDGDFAGKAAAIEEFDAAMPQVLGLDPTVVAVTGDHSTPVRLRQHTWHPVPVLLWAPATARPSGETVFGETACARGNLGTVRSTDLMPLLLAHALRLDKFGA
jgi:2,3-bisphosphoglycerate-independent phosphoglycerate mutase